VGRPPDPLTWPPLEYSGSGRFDDERGAFGVLYAAEQAEGCFVEVRAPFRPSIETFARLDALPSDEGYSSRSDAGLIGRDWCLNRLLATSSLGAGQRWLDVRSGATIASLRTELAAGLAPLNLQDFDFGDAVGRRRDVTQRIARWAFENGFNGLSYVRRFDMRYVCWALFAGAKIERVRIDPVVEDDLALIAALRFHGLRFVEAPP
jgi:hypothetical protein